MKQNRVRDLRGSEMKQTKKWEQMSSLLVYVLVFWLQGRDELARITKSLEM